MSRNSPHHPLCESEFWEFVDTINVASRDIGFDKIDPWGTQRQLIRQIFEGLEQGIRQFLVVKAGQVGASTILQLLTLYWYTQSKGLQGVCVTDSDDLRDFFRDQFTLMIKSVNPDPEHLRVNNKNQVAWHDGGRLLFQTSTKRTGKRLGIGRGVAFVHGTEVALWASAESLTILRTRFSDSHPDRLLVLESTSRGKNWWFDLVEEARDSIEIRTIFLAWWMREDYTKARGTKEFEEYGDDTLSDKERHWAHELRRRYRVELTPEQWAWRRWYLKERAGGDHRGADQEMPTLPEDSFEATGESFLGHELIKRCRQSIKKTERAAGYRYEFGMHLEESEVVPAKLALAELTVWKEAEPGHAYVVSAVPAHSAVASCSTNVVQVWKATRDELEQVAEFANTRCGLQTLAWVIVHLLGAYYAGKRGFILEVQGPGMAVLQELKLMNNHGWGTNNIHNVRKILGPINHYLWRRPDTVSAGVALQWKSSGDTLDWVLRRLKDQINGGAVLIKSPALLAECERMRLVDGAFDGTSKDSEEHRLTAAALAVESWSVQLRPLFRKIQGPAASADTVLGRMVRGFFQQLGARA